MPARSHSSYTPHHSGYGRQQRAHGPVARWTSKSPRAAGRQATSSGGPQAASRRLAAACCLHWFTCLLRLARSAILQWYSRQRTKPGCGKCKAGCTSASRTSGGLAARCTCTADGTLPRPSAPARPRRWQISRGRPESYTDRCRRAMCLLAACSLSPPRSATGRWHTHRAMFPSRWPSLNTTQRYRGTSWDTHLTSSWWWVQPCHRMHSSASKSGRSL
jgi:hypothetical protein